MPQYIIKLTDSKTNIDYYMEWSTIVDAPVTYGMSKKEFKSYYNDEYGRSKMYDLDDRLKRAEKTGTSSRLGHCVDNLIKNNRAGDDESELTKKQIIKKYCIEK